MARPRLAPLIPQATLRWILHVLAGAETIAITEQVVACRDHDDDKFLELAVNGRAELIISGDRDLLSMESFRGIPIISPAVFVRRVTDPSDA
jgi:putative PIN family toxin of toxin-antitoxin system